MPEVNSRASDEANLKRRFAAELETFMTVATALRTVKLCRLRPSGVGVASL